jgi:hypothetical protein
MERYWKARSTTLTAPTESASNTAQPDTADESILSEFDRHRLALLSNQAEDEGWESEMRRYLKDLPADVTKDTDIVKWWQVCWHCVLIVIDYADYNLLQNNGALYPTLRRIALDYLPCLASSVPCERLFSAGGEVATKRRAQLGAARFEELQMMKFAWRNNIGDLAAWNSGQVEEIDNEMREYEDMLVADRDFEEWDKSADEFVI